MFSYASDLSPMAQNPHIILISGDIGSGKDTLADFLVNHYFVDNKTHYSKKIVISDILKYLVSQKYNLPINIFTDREKKDAPLDIDSPNFILHKCGCGSQSLVYLDDAGNMKKTDNIYKPRDLLIHYAKKKKQDDIDYFIRYANEEYINNDAPIGVFTDIRYKHEKNYLKKEYLDIPIIHLWINREKKEKFTDTTLEFIAADCDIIIDNSAEPFNIDGKISDQLKHHFPATFHT